MVSFHNTKWVLTLAFYICRSKTHAENGCGAKHNDVQTRSSTALRTAKLSINKHLFENASLISSQHAMGRFLDLHYLPSTMLPEKFGMGRTHLERGISGWFNAEIFLTPYLTAAFL